MADEHTTQDPLVALLYRLMRDHIPPGKVEQIVEEHERMDESIAEFALSNAHLGRYAEECVQRLRGGTKDV